ncbi:MAG: LysR substrate-binding domain-containing protein [Pseudomonadota bacterium]|nr:LysR substrate-binding domain-containing protein [Pseudomonadota bacterium]
MDTRQLRYFLDLCETEHLTRSAANLFITQSTLSHALRQLEDSLGVALFDRVGRGLRLSQAGRLFRDYASRALHELEAGRMALDDLGALRSGCVTVGVIPSYMTALLPAAIARFHAEHPGVTLLVRELRADAIHTELSAGRLDLGISFDDPQRRDVLAQPLLTERLLLMVPAGHAWHGRATLPASALHALPCILQPRSFVTRRLLDAALATRGAVPQVVMELDTVAALLQTSAHTGLPTVVPERAAAGAPAALQAVRVVHPTPRRTAVILRRGDAGLSRAATRFVQAVREAMQHMPTGPQGA